MGRTVVKEVAHDKQIVSFTGGGAFTTELCSCTCTSDETCERRSEKQRCRFGCLKV